MCENDLLVDDFQCRVQLAKLDTDDLVKPSMRLKFHSFASPDEVALMQVDNEMLHLIEEGKSLVIRGDENDAAALCTDSVTYDVKNTSTSNTLILFDDALLPETKMTQSEELFSEEQLDLVDKKAVAWKFNYYELKQVNPSTTRLVDSLNVAPYKGPRHEAEISLDKKFSLSDFQAIIQASEVEIVEKLSKMNCCCISGKWRMLDFGYIVECMGEMLQLVEAESWSCGQIPVEDMCLKINDCGELVPCFIVKHLLRSFGSQFTDDEGTQYYKLDERKICQFFAEMLLKDVGRFNYSEFMEVWKESVPRGMTVDEKFLQGLALIDKSSRQPAIFLFKSEELPLNLENRFDILFQNRQKWTLDEITPYVEDVCLKGQTVASLLTKYTRSSTLNGVKVFSTRKLNRTEPF